MGKVVTVGGVTTVSFTAIGLMAPIVFPEIPKMLAILFLIMAAASLVTTFVWVFLDRPKYAPRPLLAQTKETVSRARKRKILDDCRKLIANWGFDHNHRSQREFLEESEAFLSVKKYLSPEFKFAYNQKPMAIIFADEVNPRPYLMRVFSEELDRLETEWKLDG